MLTSGLFYETMDLSMRETDKPNSMTSTTQYKFLVISLQLLVLGEYKS